MGKVNYTQRLLLVRFILLAGLLMMQPAISFGADAVCARVKIEIKQELTLERQAFDAHMRINNGLSHIILENVNVAVSFADAEGNPVLASSDPANTDALFFIRLDSMENIEDASGSGTVEPDTSADIHWLIIPASGSSNGLEQGTLYYVGATLTYTIGGAEKVTEVTPDYIFVKPMPEITLDYFLPPDVYGDEAFTPEIEPPVPFSVGVRVKNNGYGVARNLKIESAQPKIIENEQGLLVGVAIEGSEVNGQPASDSLLADFGDIAPNAAGVARWTMTCSLSGQFVEFTAGFSHSDELGGELTSLIEAANTHFLVHDVRVDLAGRDLIRDFLAKDGAVYRVYESDTTDTVVTDQSAAATLQMNGHQGNLSVPATAGFMVVRLADSLAGQKAIKEAIRSDGKVIKAENIWLSKTRDEANNWQYFINLFDVNTTDSYTIRFEDVAAVPLPPVLQFIPDCTRVEGQQVSFIVEASDPNGTIPGLSSALLPVGAGFDDQSDGTGIFDWTPVVGQAGRYEIVLTASDGVLSDSQRAIITVSSVGDADSDGMSDDWEMEHFGTLERDGNGDFDGDGISDLDEYLNGSNPKAEDHAPSIPEIQSPAIASTVYDQSPELVINNSTDADGDAITYEFEVFSDFSLTHLVAGDTGVAEGTDTATWTVPDILEDNTWYDWRVRASDGYSFSLWAYGSFFVNTENDPPGAFDISSPAESAEVDTQTPWLQINNAADADEDALTYIFEVYADSDLTTLIAALPEITQGPDGTTAWQVNASLADSTWYYWRVIANDGQGAQSQTAAASFFVNLANPAPQAPTIVSPAAGSEVGVLELDLVVNNAADADITAYVFELDTVNTFDSQNKQTSGDLSAGVDTSVWSVAGLADNTRYFWQVKSSNGSAESGWVQGSFFVNIANDRPATPTIKNPGHKGWADTLTPTFEVNPVLDPDNDSLSYRFEVYADDALTALIEPGESDGPQWTPSSDLADKTRYYWRAQVEDEHGIAGDWCSAASFFVKYVATGPPTDIFVNVTTNAGRALSGLKVYAYTESGSYTGKFATTDENGTARFEPLDFAEGSYKFRMDYLQIKFWSDSIDFPHTATVNVVIDEENVALTVTTGTGPTEGVKVYLYNNSGAYLGIYAITDGDGRVSFVLPVGQFFKFRADILGTKYWTGVITVSGGGTHNVSLDTEGGIFQVTVQQTAGLPMEGIKVYLFSPSGVYLGLNQTTDSAGIAAFKVSNALYKVRADYLGYQFWSEETAVPVDTSIDLTIPHQNVMITLQGQFQEDLEPLEGIKTYLFTPSGSYLGRYQFTDANGKVFWDLPEQAYKVRADCMSRQFWSEEFSWQDTAVNVPMADAEITVTGSGLPVEGEKVYVYSAAGAYLSLYETTDSAGKAFFHIPARDYMFRADHLGNQNWTDVKTLTAGEVNPINISAGGGSFTYTVLKTGAVPLEGVNCYLFDGQGSYLGLYGSTNSDGQVSFDLADGTYMLRVDYLGYQFWNDLVTLPGDLSAEMTIDEETVEVTVSTGSGTVEGVKVYLYSESGGYLSWYEQTDADGKVLFALPVGKNYQFRADILSNPYWSDVITVAGDGTNIVSIDAGGGNLQVTVQKDADRPMAGIKTYLYHTSDSYLGLSNVTDACGMVDYDVPVGTYKVRADYLGYQFWSAEIHVTGDTANEITIAHQQVEIIVQGLFQGTGAPLEGIKVYLFSPTDSYLSYYQFTNAAGKVSFDLPQQDYKVRADYLGQQFWSTLFIWQNTTVDIAMADAAISVTGAGLPRAGLKVYAYSATDSYLGMSETTHDQGQVTFRLPSGDYRFRVDYQGSQFWSEVESLAADLANEVIVSVGGGAFTLTVLQSGTDPLVGINCYVFSEGGSYLGLKGATGAAGQVFFDLANGSCKFRLDYLGYQHWSEVYQVPDTLSENMTIAHQDAVVTVEGLYQSADPLQGLIVYLFTPAGSYVGQKLMTDDNGQVAFTLPDEQYKVRVDYLGRQFWSEVFQSQNTTVTINQGLAALHVNRSETDVTDAKVYLFTAAGSYLGQHAYTDLLGKTSFVLPVGNYKFRIDESGEQHWSPVIEITDGAETVVEIDLDN